MWYYQCYMTETQNKDLDLEGLKSYSWMLAFNAEKFLRFDVHGTVHR
jgi:hypothetical protein